MLLFKLTMPSSGIQHEYICSSIFSIHSPFSPWIGIYAGTWLCNVRFYVLYKYICMYNYVWWNYHLFLFFKGTTWWASQMTLFLPILLLISSHWIIHCAQRQLFRYSHLKGSVSWDLRWVLLYINWKLPLRLIISSHKILGLVYNSHITGRRTLVLWYGFIQTILKAEENVGCAILKFATAPLSEMNLFMLLIFYWPGQSENFTDDRPYRRLQSVQISDQ